MAAQTADPVSEAERQAVLDEEHLRLLAFFHYVSGGITVAFCLFFEVWMLFMAAIFSSVPPTPDHAPPIAIFWDSALFLSWEWPTASSRSSRDAA